LRNFKPIFNFPKEILDKFKRKYILLHDYGSKNLLFLNQSLGGTMYQNIYSYTESRMQELRNASAEPQATPASLSEQLRHDAAAALIGLGNWIKPQAKSAAGAQSHTSLRRAGLAS
jgi:hypothetical protein